MGYIGPYQGYVGYIGLYRHSGREGLWHARIVRADLGGMGIAAADYSMGSMQALQCVSFWGLLGFLVWDCHILPKKELHRRVWVEMLGRTSVGLEVCGPFRVCGLLVSESVWLSCWFPA